MVKWRHSSRDHTLTYNRIQLNRQTQTHTHNVRACEQNTTKLLLESESLIIVNISEIISIIVNKIKMNHFHLVIGIIFIAFCVENGKFIIKCVSGKWKNYCEINQRAYLTIVYYLHESHCPFYLFFFNYRFDMSTSEVINASNICFGFE